MYCINVVSVVSSALMAIKSVLNANVIRLLTPALTRMHKLGAKPILPKAESI